MPREIISIHIGGCGCDVGTEMWRQLASEHGHGTSPATRKYADGAANTRHNQNGQVSSFFHESVFGSLKPRCVFADTDPSSSISLSVRNPDSMFDREDVLLHKQDCRGNYFEGKSRATACGIANDVVDRITSQLDRCDNPSGFLLHHSFGGGTGSGIGAAVMEMIKDQFPKKTLFEPAVFPSTDSSTSTVEPYNCVFALAATRDLASLTLMLDNQAVFKICREKQRISNPSFADMNRVIANVISGCTASLRAPSSLNASLDEIVTNLVPDPTFRYPIVAMAPFSIAKSYGTRELITNLFDSSSCLCDVPNLRLNRYFSATVLCRGPNPIPVVEVQKVVHSLKGDSASHRQPIKFVPWVPNSFKVGIVDSSTGLGSETQLVMLANSTAVRSLFLRQYRKFLELFYHRAYVWQFLEAGGEVDDFMDAKEAVRVIMDREMAPPREDNTGFNRTSLSHTTLYEFLRSAGSSGVSANPLHRRPYIAPPPPRGNTFFPPSSSSSSGAKPLTALQRLAMDGPTHIPKPTKTKPIATSRMVVDLQDQLTPKKENRQMDGNPPPMFEASAKERRGTRLSHTKGSSPQQLAKLKSRLGVVDGSGTSSSTGHIPKRLLSIDDLHKAILGVDFDRLDSCTEVDFTPPGDVLRYGSLEEYKQRQSMVLLMETMAGFHQSLSTGFVSVGSTCGNAFYQTVNVGISTAVRQGRDWCLLTVKKDPSADSSSVDLAQGDVVLLVKPQSAVLTTILKYGFLSRLSLPVLSEKGQILLGIVERSKPSLISSKQGRSVQLRCALASKDSPLGYSPSDGSTVGSEWVAVVIHSVLTVEREWKALCSLTATSPYVPALLGAISPVTRTLQSRPSLTNQLDAIGELNWSQRGAVEAAAGGPLSSIVIVQGPPGTGKTHTLITLLQLLRKRGLKKIIVCAPSNAAVDEVMVRFLALGLRTDMLRVGRNSRPELSPYSLEQLVMESQASIEAQRHEAYKQRKSKLHDSIQTTIEQIATARDGGEKANLIRVKERLKEQLDSMKTREQESVRIERDSIYRKFLNKAQFVFGTLSAFGADNVSLNLTEKVDVCVIDEAAQAIEVSALIPLKFNPGRLVLVGDPQQLPAVVKSVAAKKARFDLSLIERLQLLGQHKTHMLCEQYRMAPRIADFPSSCFYEGKLITANSVFARNSIKVESALIRDSPIVFVDVPSAGDMKQGTSIINPREGRLTAELARWLIDEYRLTSVGVITPYRQQVNLIRGLLSSVTVSGLEVDSVDAFQGREKDVVIFDCVRSGGSDGSNSVGFLADQRRLNVAITRAKHALWIVGNAAFLKAHGGPVWTALVQHCEANGCVITATAVDEILEQTTTDHRKRARFIH